MYDMEIQVIFEKLRIVEKLYDQVRLVDPLLRRVIQDGKEKEFTVRCFDHFGRDKVCNNCVSMRAYNKNQTYIKLERAIHDVYMVTAIPVKLEGRTVVIELLKNITNNIVFQDDNGNHNNALDGMAENVTLIASKDPLTGIYNRRYIHEKLPVDLFSAAISNHNIAIIMADIDYFKLVNDTYGHLAGDYVLKTVAKILSEGLMRESDWVARYGGEEFLICLPGAKRDTAIEIAERIRRSLENHTIRFDKHDIQVTASFGIYNLIPDIEMKMEELIDRADKKLFEAKSNGRNRVEVWP